MFVTQSVGNVLVLRIESRACQVNATLTGQDRRTLSMIPKGRRAEILTRSFEALLQYATLGDSHALRAAALPSISCALPRHGQRGSDSRPRCGVNLSCTGWRLSGDLPKRPGESISLTVTRPKKQLIKTPEAAVRWPRGREFVVENILIESQSMRGLSIM